MSLFDAQTLPVQRVTETATEENRHCVEAVFPPLAQGDRALRLVVDTLKDRTGADVSGPWEFVWSTLPQQTIIPGITPLGSQTIGDVKVTLLQAYIDALRMTVVYRIEGTTQHHEIGITDVEGKPLNIEGGGMGPTADDPNVFTASLKFAQPLVGERFVGKLNIIISPWESQGGQVFTFDLGLPVYPPLVIIPAQTITAEGLEMRLEKLEITPSFTDVFLCYQKPSPADWMLSNDKTVLQIGQAQAQFSNYTMVMDEDYRMQERPEWATLPGRARCVRAGFSVGHHNQAEKLTLVVGLEQSVPEVIPDDQLQAARQKLRQQGIEMDWVTFSGNGGGGAEPKITQKPDGMTDEEAIKRFYEALGYYFHGTWTFSLDIQP
jgi:hypothetical protein